MLDGEHTPEAVSARLAGKPSASYLRDFIYGAVDGSDADPAVSGEHWL